MSVLIELIFKGNHIWKKLHDKSGEACYNKINVDSDSQMHGSTELKHFQLHLLNGIKSYL